MILHQLNSTETRRNRQDRADGRAGFRPDIEGLRAVAVLAVVLFHAAVPGLRGGYVGVDVFFVISGFLITRLLWREADATGTVRLRNFYAARARRLLPAATLVGAVIMIASVALLPPLRAREVVIDGIASALYVSNYTFLLQGVDYFGAEQSQSPFLHYWSLGVEEQFYFVWAPLILCTVWVIRRVRRRNRNEAASSRRPYVLALSLVAVASFALSMVVTHLMPPAAFFALPTRAWQLALGGLVALTAGQWGRLPSLAAAVTGSTGLGMIVLACALLSQSTPYPGTAAILPTMGAVFVIGAGCAAPTAGCGRLLGTRPLRAVGRISYSWYLWHWPVLVLVPVIVGHDLGLAARLVAAVFSAGLAVATFRFVENPLRFSPKIRESAWRSLGLGAGVTAVAGCVGAALLVGMPTPVGRGSPAQPLAFTLAPVPVGESADAHDNAVRQAFSLVNDAVAASAHLEAVPSNLQPALAETTAERQAMRLDGCLLAPFETGQPECVTGDPTSTMTVALVGDSFAAMWNPAFEQIAVEQHWRLQTLTRSLCPLMHVRITNPYLRREDTNCEQWRSQIFDKLRTERPRLIVLSMSRGYDATTGVTPYDPAWLDALTRVVAQLRSTGAQVLVLGPIPDPRTHVPICLSDHLDDATACAPSRSSAVNEPGVAAEAAATELGGGHYVDLTDLFCTDHHCPVIVGNTLVYVDQGHLTPQHSRALAPVIGQLVARALAQN
ncbi:acyltransferase family protein [Mycolicibacterium pulveris]|uniref:acyltransferase family protein n=1 Tax=Mycolicibacterium pulveris TaxID=36813 RepID=UPI0013D3D5E7|nr:acyltransferase family protein [Mycolicibacterium pulveris]MCV6983876.1 acyltransferase family protein [Mycolicibacterium pulveris]